MSLGALRRSLLKSQLPCIPHFEAFTATRLQALECPWQEVAQGRGTRQEHPATFWKPLRTDYRCQLQILTMLKTALVSGQQTLSFTMSAATILTPMSPSRLSTRRSRHSSEAMKSHGRRPYPFIHNLITQHQSLPRPPSSTSQPPPAETSRAPTPQTQQSHKRH